MKDSQAAKEESTVQIPAVCGIVVLAASCTLAFFLLSAGCGNPVTDNRVKPRFAGPADTAVFVKDSVIVTAHPLNARSGNLDFVWYLDGIRLPSRSKTDSACRLYFGIRDTGMHRLVVFAEGNSGLWSGPETSAVFVRLGRPTLHLIARDSSVFPGAAFEVFPQAFDTNGTIAGFFVRIDSGAAVFDASPDTFHFFFPLAGRDHRIVITAMDDDSLVSNPESLWVTVLSNHPVVSISCAGLVAIHDTLMVHGLRRDTSVTTVRWLWAKGRKVFTDTTAADSFGITFNRSDSGLRYVYVKAVDGHGQESNVDSASVVVRLMGPVVGITHDTLAYVNDTVTISARGADPNGWVARYVWVFDSLFSDTTNAPVIRHAWRLGDTGRVRLVCVKAIDNDSIESRPDTMRVTLTYGHPYIASTIADTAMRWTDTITERCKAFSTGGKIEKYLWSVGGSGWTDSSATDSMRIRGKRHGLLTVIAGARDVDGLIARDTFVINCRAVACTAYVFDPRQDDTLHVPLYGLGKGNVRFMFLAQRADQAEDAFVYKVFTGPSPSQLSEQYSGTNNATILSVLDTGTCYWKVLAVDSHNDSGWTSGSQVCRLQKRVCFIGHSIVVGLEGDIVRGGFRRTVIDSLRGQAGYPSGIGCEGPLTSGLLKPGSDDSCMAQCERRAFDIYDTLFMYPDVNADLWIFMNGANDGYSRYPGWYYCQNTIDLMHSRNPHSEIYVINGLPLPPETGNTDTGVDLTTRKNLPVFNHLLDSSVTQRRNIWQTRGENGVWLVDAFAAMSNPADSSCNPVYFNDIFHPNQVGYEFMAQLILNTMKSAKSAFFK
jgi:hypothetical protein